MRRSYVQIDGVLYEKGTEPESARRRGPMISRDLPDFVSPIDGSVVSGRRGLREHCRRHDVVPTAELKGLPAVMPEQRLSKSQRYDDVRRAMYHHKGY